MILWFIIWTRPCTRQAKSRNDISGAHVMQCRHRGSTTAITDKRPPAPIFFPPCFETAIPGYLVPRTQLSTSGLSNKDAFDDA